MVCWTFFYNFFCKPFPVKCLSIFVKRLSKKEILFFLVFRRLGWCLLQTNFFLFSFSILNLFHTNLFRNSHWKIYSNADWPDWDRVEMATCWLTDWLTDWPQLLLEKVVHLKSKKLKRPARTRRKQNDANEKAVSAPGPTSPLPASLQPSPRGCIGAGCYSNALRWSITSVQDYSSQQCISSAVHLQCICSAFALHLQCIRNAFAMHL